MLAFAVAPRLGAVLEELTDGDAALALNIANASETRRALFHSPYVITPKDPLIEQIDVITEFRRLVMAAEAQLAAGNWMLGRGGFDQKGRSLRDELRPLAGQVTIRARLRFDPMHTYVTLPPFDILLGEPTLLVVQTTRTPHVVPVSGDAVGGGEIMYGATLEASFSALTIGDRALPVRIISPDKELFRAVVEFSRLD
jgi:hypothetical protein